MADSATAQIVRLIGNYMTTGNKSASKASITYAPCIAKASSIEKFVKADDDGFLNENTP